MRPVITVESVFKSYPWNQLRARTLKEAVVSIVRPKAKSDRRFEALKDVSFTVFEGEAVGVIGSNGSGKSTILKLITGIIKPNSGRVTVAGRMSALLELGAGFHPDFTGRENVYLNGSILGLQRKEIDEAFERIVAFAEIGDFIDQPVKTYSSGMYTRLAFAIAVNVDPDILVIDEVLAVGDLSFQQKCFEKMRQFRAAGKTILLVSHDHASVKSLCDRAVWIDKGLKRMDGPVEEIVEAYVASQQGERPVESDLPTVLPDPPVRIEELAAYDPNGRQLDVFNPLVPTILRYTWRADEDFTCHWAFTIRRLSDGFVCGGNLTELLHFKAGDSGSGTFTMPNLDLAEAGYELVIEAFLDNKSIPFSGKGVLLGTDTTWSGPGAYHIAGTWSLANMPNKPLEVS